MADAKTVLDFTKQHDAKILDLRFTDIPGLWHHISYPIAQLSESSFEEGFGIDGSSIRGWAGIHESDMLLKPDPNFHLLDPFTQVPTLALLCDVVDPVTKKRYDRDTRYKARKAELYLASTGVPTLARRLNSSSSITCASTSVNSTAFTTLTPKRDAGIRAGNSAILGTGPVSGKATFPFLPLITIRICDQK